MNERFKQLAVQSKLGSADFGNGIQYYVATQETFEKFAESIVQECIDVVGKATASPNGVQSIMKHFGVEE